MDPFVLSLLRAQLSNDALPSDSVTDVYNSFREAAPHAQPDDSVVGFVPFLQSCFESDATFQLSPDGVFHAVLTFFADRVLNAPPDRYRSVIEHPKMRSYLQVAVEPARHTDDDDEHRDTSPQPSASPWHLSREAIVKHHLPCAVRSAPLLELLKETSFTTSNESSRRAFALAFLACLPVKRALPAPVRDIGSIPNIQVLGTGADWMQLAHAVDILFHMLPCEVNDANLQERFHAAIRRVTVMRVEQREEFLQSAYFYPPGSTEAAGWLIDLALGLRDRMVVMFPYESAGSGYVLVSALQNGRCFSESVVSFSGMEWHNALQNKRGSFRSYALTDRDAIELASNARTELRSAIEQCDMEKALSAHSKLPYGNELLLTMIVERRWDLVRMLADRLMVPEGAEDAAAGADFLPCDADDDDDDEDDQKTDEQAVAENVGSERPPNADVQGSIARAELWSAMEQCDVEKALVAHSKLPDGNELLLNMIVERRWDLVRMWLERLRVRDENLSRTPNADVQGTAVPSAFLRHEQNASVDSTFVSVKQREFTIRALPRDSMLRLQRWALDEMILHPTLDLTGLTTLNTNPTTTLFRVHVEVRDA